MPKGVPGKTPTSKTGVANRSFEVVVRTNDVVSARPPRAPSVSRHFTWKLTTKRRRSKEDVEQTLNELFVLVGPRILDAAWHIESESDLRELADRIKAALPGESEASKAVGPVYTSTALAKWLGISRQALNKKAQKADVLSMHTADDVRVYPAWQFAPNRTVRRGVADAVKALRDAGMDEWTTAAWFKGKSSALDGKSAADWLAESGEPDAVVREARRTANRWSQ